MYLILPPALVTATSDEYVKTLSHLLTTSKLNSITFVKQTAFFKHRLNSTKCINPFKTKSSKEQIARNLYGYICVVIMSGPLHEGTPAQ